MKLILLFLISLLSIYNLYGQVDNFCNADEINSQAFQQFPDRQNRILQANQELEVFTKEFVTNYIQNKNEEPYIIPVVFHIIHENDESNITDEQILDAVRLVNQQFRKQNSDTSTIKSEFKQLASDVEVEIRLARLDPNGNCTNGITRTFSSLTNAGDHSVKSLIHWPPNKYLNIYVTKSASMGLAGHCLMPAVADTIPEWDGIVIQHTYIGSIGTSENFRRTVLTHEIGHYLNLYHIWGGNNVPGFYYLPVGDGNNCDYDDNVADTPNTIGWSDCNINSVSCGTLDNVQNYMDYSYCHRMFTEGQKQHIHAALNSPIAGRNNLWTEQNLLETGVTGFNELCKPNFRANTRIICEGDSITFTDLSYFNVSSRLWNFEGGNITSSSDSIVTVTYNQAGTYSIGLEISDGENSIDSLFFGYIKVMESTPETNLLIETFEEEENYKNSWQTDETGVINFQRVQYGNNSNYGIYADNYNSSNSTSFHLISQPFNASNYSKYIINFDYAYAKTSSSSAERIYILTSIDCGKTWSTRSIIKLTEANLENFDEEYFPTEETTWIHHEIEFPAALDVASNQLIQLRFDGKSGNNLFIDNINIFDESTLNLSSKATNSTIQIYPNPSKNLLNISSSNNLNGEIVITNLNGQIVATQSLFEKKNSIIDISNTAAGTYFLKYIPSSHGELSTIQKIIILD